MLLAAALFAIVLWWGSTQALILLTRRASPRALDAFALTLAVAASVAAVALSSHTGVAAAVGAFSAGVALWGAFEISFLSGTLLGIETPPRTRFGGRAWAAFRAIAWHELGLVATVLLLAAALWNAPNPGAFHVFALLYLMRASAKLNLFLGVRNLAVEFLPAPVRHLGRHFRRARMNPLFPFSVLAGTLAAALLLRAAVDPATLPAQAVSAMLLAALAALGTLEHWLMVTPLSPTKLWSVEADRVTAPRPVGTAGLAHTLGVNGGHNGL